MITVKFYGELAEKFGETFKMKASTTSEVFHALDCQMPKLKPFMHDRQYRVRIGRKFALLETLEETFNEPLGETATIHVMPVVAGSGKYGQFLMGAVIFVVGAIAWYVTQGTAPWAYNLMWMGGAMMLGGVVQMLTKTPKLDGGGKGMESSKSNIFSNVSNTVAHGSHVPIIYGEIRVGSKVISQGAYAIGTNSNPKDKTENTELNIIGKQVVVVKDREGKDYPTDIANEKVQSRNYVAELVPIK